MFTGARCHVVTLTNDNRHAWVANIGEDNISIVDVARRREIVYDIQRYLSQQVYYLYTSPSAKVIGGWEPYVKNFMPNIGNDYGGRLMAAWLDR